MSEVERGWGLTADTKAVLPIEPWRMGRRQHSRHELRALAYFDHVINDLSVAQYRLAESPDGP
jgi:hypothetical protein